MISGAITRAPGGAFFHALIAGKIGHTPLNRLTYAVQEGVQA